MGVMIRSEFMAAINAVASDRGIEPEQVVETLKHALLAAYRKDYGEPEDIEVHIDAESGEITLMQGSEDVTPVGFGRILLNRLFCNAYVKQKRTQSSVTIGTKLILLSRVCFSARKVGIGSWILAALLH